jgi:hypothetical protein
MKRLFLACIACGALLVPSLASGSSAGAVSSNARGDGYKPSFGFTHREGPNGNLRKVFDVFWGDAALGCEIGGPVFVSGGEPGDGYGPIRVRDGRFGKQFELTDSPDEEGTVGIHGRYWKESGRLKISLRIRGDFGAHEDCDSRRLTYGP